MCTNSINESMDYFYLSNILILYSKVYDIDYIDKISFKNKYLKSMSIFTKVLKNLLI